MLYVKTKRVQRGVEHAAFARTHHAVERAPTRGSPSNDTGKSPCRCRRKRYRPLTGEHYYHSRAGAVHRARAAVR